MAFLAAQLFFAAQPAVAAAGAEDARLEWQQGYDAAINYTIVPLDPKNFWWYKGYFDAAQHIYEEGITLQKARDLFSNFCYSAVTPPAMKELAKQKVLEIEGRLIAERLNVQPALLRQALREEGSGVNAGQAAGAAAMPAVAQPAIPMAAAAAQPAMPAAAQGQPQDQQMYEKYLDEAENLRINDRLLEAIEAYHKVDKVGVQMSLRKRAQFGLAEIYRLGGNGVEKNLYEAEHFYKLATAQSAPRAIRERARERLAETALEIGRPCIAKAIEQFQMKKFRDGLHSYGQVLMNRNYPAAEKERLLKDLMVKASALRMGNPAQGIPKNLGLAGDYYWNIVHNYSRDFPAITAEAQRLLEQVHQESRGAAAAAPRPMMPAAAQPAMPAAAMPRPMPAAAAAQPAIPAAAPRLLEDSHAWWQKKLSLADHWRQQEDTLLKSFEHYVEILKSESPNIPIEFKRRAQFGLGEIYRKECWSIGVEVPFGGLEIIKKPKIIGFKCDPLKAMAYYKMALEPGASDDIKKLAQERLQELKRTYPQYSDVIIEEKQNDIIRRQYQDEAIAALAAMPGFQAAAAAAQPAAMPRPMPAAAQPAMPIPMPVAAQNRVYLQLQQALQAAAAAAQPVAAAGLPQPAAIPRPMPAAAAQPVSPAQQERLYYETQLNQAAEFMKNQKFMLAKNIFELVENQNDVPDLSKKAALKLGILYSRGVGPIEQNLLLARHYLNKVITGAGADPETHRLAQSYLAQIDSMENELAVKAEPEDVEMEEGMPALEGVAAVSPVAMQPMLPAAAEPEQEFMEYEEPASAAAAQRDVQMQEGPRGVKRERNQEEETIAQGLEQEAEERAAKKIKQEPKE